MENNKEEKKESIFLNTFFKSVAFVLSILFPIVKMFFLNKQLELAEQTLGVETKDQKGNYISPYDYFPRQRKRNVYMSLISMTPLLFSFLIGYQILSTNEIFVKGVVAAKKEFVKFRLIEAKKKLEIANKIDPSVNKDIQTTLMVIFIGFSLSFISGSVLVFFHPILTETKKLKKYLSQSGYIKIEDNSTILATKVGFLIDIAGNTPREIADSDRIWIPLNIRVNKDWAENPKKRSLVFFKRAYELKKGDQYGFDKIPKK